MRVVVEVPDAIARQWGETPELAARRVLEDAAIESYREGRLTQRQLGQVLGMDYWQVEQFLAARGVPLNYTSSDLEADAAALGSAQPPR